MSWSALVSLLVGLAVAGFLVASNDPAEIGALVAGAGWGMVAVVLMRLPQLVISALGWAPLIDARVRPGWGALCRLRWIRDAVNTLLPVAQVGGEFVRTQLLVRLGVGTAPATASVALDLATELVAQFVFSVVGLLVVLRVAPEAGAIGWLAAATAACGVMGVGFMAAQRWGLFRLVAHVVAKLRRRPAPDGTDGVHGAVLALYRAPGRLWASGAVHLGSWFLGVLETWVALRILGIEAGLVEALVIESLGQLVRSMGFMVPGAVGVQEGGFVVVCGLFGIPPEQALAFALVRRIRDIALALPGIVAWRWEVATTPVVVGRVD